AVDGSTAADGQISHVEGFGGIIAVEASESEQILERDGKVLLGIAPVVLLQQIRRKAVETGSDGSVGGEQIAGSGHRQGEIEGLLVISHVRSCPLKNGEGSVTFVEMTNLRPQAQSVQKTPSRNSEDLLLLQ